MATKGSVKGIVANLVTIEADGPVAQNEICYITVGDTPLMSEVIRVGGKYAYAQVFESTRGMRIGDPVTFEGHMLEVTLGPGMLSKNYDGLQNDLDKMEGVFLRRGSYTSALDEDKKWDFTPLAQVGDRLSAGAWLGEVTENFQPIKIMVPFSFEGIYTLKSLRPAGSYTIAETIAELVDEAG
ncbi:MAG: V-type ATP synthase subunit A, partial [Porphyromonadaceae bacterium]|nr:V-type ATP synthase subunit A [Porphyromonadaceae bacterium]